MVAGKVLKKDNPYMLDVDEFMSLSERRRFELLLIITANINQTLEAMGNDLGKLKINPLGDDRLIRGNTAIAECLISVKHITKDSIREKYGRPTNPIRRIKAQEQETPYVKKAEAIIREKKLKLITYKHEGSWWAYFLTVNGDQVAPAGFGHLKREAISMAKRMLIIHKPYLNFPYVTELPIREKS